jgi:hypothetical protein
MAAASETWLEDMVLGADDELEKTDDVGDEALDVDIGMLNARLSDEDVDPDSRLR